MGTNGIIGTGLGCVTGTFFGSGHFFPLQGTTSAAFTSPLIGSMLGHDGPDVWKLAIST